VLQPSLPRDAYVDDDVFALERERVFLRSWTCIGREEDVAEAPGSYVRCDSAGESILVVRDAAGRLRAFANLCAHRGAELVDTTDPAAHNGCFDRAIRCPYHLWTYEFDGRLRGAPHLDAADVAGLGLTELDLDSWGGFLFLRQVSPADGSSLAESLGEVTARLANYPLAAMRRGERIVYEVAANWKVLSENYNECYHCGPVHPELCALVPSFRRGGGNELDWSNGIPHRAGAYTFTTSGTTIRRPFPGLNEAELVNHKGELIYPNLWLSLACDHVAAFTLHPNGPASTTVICDFLFAADELVRRDFDPSDATELWDLVNRQDWKICERVQRGMTSRHFRQGWYAPMEDYSLDMRRYWNALVHGPEAPTAGGEERWMQ
jgi:glycine betaine catabolism A